MEKGALSLLLQNHLPHQKHFSLKGITVEFTSNSRVGPICRYHSSPFHVFRKRIKNTHIVCIAFIRNSAVQALLVGCRVNVAHIFASMWISCQNLTSWGPTFIWIMTWLKVSVEWGRMQLFFMIVLKFMNQLYQYVWHALVLLEDSQDFVRFCS